MIEPNPGSDKAVAKGCRCPVLDNAHGRGYFAGTGFVIVEDCPLHGKDFRAAVHEAGRRALPQPGDGGEV